MKDQIGLTNLKELISGMEPILNPGRYIFATVKKLDAIPRNLTICEITEQEGATVVMSKSDADSLGIEYKYIAAWITLKVHSSLEAVGLTAAFSATLAAHDISCNVIAGYYHDHIFVNYMNKDRALQALLELTY